VIPSELIIPEVDIGKTFTIKINITEVTNLWSWKVNLSWNPSVLKVVSVTEGPFLKDQASPTLFTVTPWDPAKGYIPEISCVSLAVPAKTASGSGTLATITFNATAPGDSYVNLTNTRLIGPPPAKPEISHTVENGTVTVIPEFTTFTILAIFLIATTAVAIAAKKLSPKKPTLH